MLIELVTDWGLFEVNLSFLFSPERFVQRTDEYLIIRLDAWEIDRLPDVSRPVSLFLISDVDTRGISCQLLGEQRENEKEKPIKKEYKASDSDTSGSSQFIWLASPVRR